MKRNIRKDRTVNFNNCKYGILLEVDTENRYYNEIFNAEPFQNGYHCGMRVHFFNEKGVFLGNIYRFVPYKCVRFQEDSSMDYPRHYFYSSFSFLKMFIFKIRCNIITYLIRKTQKGL